MDPFKCACNSALGILWRSAAAAGDTLDAIPRSRGALLQNHFFLLIAGNKGPNDSPAGRQPPSQVASEGRGEYGGDRIVATKTMFVCLFWFR